MSVAARYFWRLAVAIPSYRVRVHGGSHAVVALRKANFLNVYQYTVASRRIEVRRLCTEACQDYIYRQFQFYHIDNCIINN